MSEALDERRAQKDRVLEAAMLHAAFDGWSRRTLVNAAADAGLDPATARRLFPQGGDSLLAWLDDWADRRCWRRLRIARSAAAGTPAHRAPGAHAAGAADAAPRGDPPRGGRAWHARQSRGHRARALAHRRSDVANAGLGGAPSDGFDYYSRRATLAGVLTASFLYWLDDKSDECADSWAFLDRRIEDVMRIGRARSESALGRLADRAPASVGRPLTSVGSATRLSRAAGSRAFARRSAPAARR